MKEKEHTDWLTKYEEPIKASIEYYNHRAVSLSLNESARKKYTGSGEAKYFPGFSVVSWLRPQSLMFRILSSYRKRLKLELDRKNLSHCFAFLPENTYHLTLADLVTFPDEYLSENIENSVHAKLQEVRNKRIRRIHMNVLGISICAGTSLVAWVYPLHERDLIAIHDIRKILHSLRTLGNDVFPSDPEKFIGHVTLAYIYNDIEEDAYTSLKSLLIPHEHIQIGTHIVTELELRYFENMETWSGPLIRATLR